MPFKTHGWWGLRVPLFLFKTTYFKTHISLYPLTLSHKHIRPLLCFPWKSADHVEEIRTSLRIVVGVRFESLSFLITVAEYPLVVLSQNNIHPFGFLSVYPLCASLPANSRSYRSFTSGCDSRTQMGWVASMGRGWDSLLWDARGDTPQSPISPPQ